MKAIVSCLAAGLIALACSGVARAQQPHYSGYYGYQPQAPAACPAGFAGFNNYGAAGAPSYGPNPPWPPFNGVRPPSGFGAQRFANHWYARGPRDYFMLDLR
jgi:hypothetical protein